MKFKTEMKQLVILILSFISVFPYANGGTRNSSISENLPWKDVFETYNLPDSLSMLPAYKTGYNVHYSKDGSAGIWGLSIPVARRYGLTVNEIVDQRMDVELSSKAAAEYLSDLVGYYKNTDLAVLAYLNGAPLLNNTARKYEINLDSITSENIIMLENLLPGNKKQYACGNPQSVSLDSIYNHTGYAQVQITSPLRAKSLMESLKISDEEFRDMNPALRDYENWITDALVYIPADGNDELPEIPEQLYACEKEAQVLAVQAKQEAEKKKIEEQKAKIKKAAATKIYRVRSGDSLSRIAHKYRVTVAQLKRWNHLRSDFLRVGQRLKIR